MKKYSWYRNEKGIYLCLSEYDSYDSFDEALDLIYKLLNCSFTEPIDAGYMKISDFNYEEEKLTLVFHEDLGCSIFGSFTQEETLKKIASLLPELKET
ncbi:hypothetical protein EHQ12_19255 [Leptospira gomenensis]|uniref:hypothetical protein n=1 Tax=Leptospira gomenensis TaxID=2484974 RepID=UPI001090DA50|nr:hypothetical protein [Leptospira gomenensis]TGK32362.1 hypothetical protein EHQ12_19255 [Leptospira gomenensis]